MTENVAVLIPDNPASVGHVWVTPRQPYPILELVPDAIVEEMFHIANKISVTLFDSLGASGSNIFVQNGLEAGQTVNQILLHVVSRDKDDDVQLQWSPKELSEDELGTLEIKIKETQDTEPPPAKPITVETKDAPKEEKPYDYLTAALRRLP